MKTFGHEFVVSCNVDKVWDFFIYTKLIGAISPDSLKERLVRATNDKLTTGTELWISTEFLFRRIW